MMRNTIVTFLVIFSLHVLLVPSISFADRVTPSDRVENHVNIRKEAKSGADEIGELHPGESLEFLSSEPHWYRVKLDNSQEGFVHKSWTRIVSDEIKNLEIHFIDVGQGDSTLVVCPNGDNILIDAGSSSDEPQVDYVRDYILKVLDRRERRVDTLIITHPHTDHYNLIGEVLRDVPVGQIFMVGGTEDYNTSFRKFLAGTPTTNKTILSSSYFDSPDSPNSAISCGGTSTYILAAATPATYSAKNANSIVLMLRYGDFEAVLTGDATSATEKVIMERYTNEWLDVDALKVGHHGSLATSKSATWTKRTKPKVAVISAGYNNTHGHPQKEVVDRLEPYTEDKEYSHLMRYVTGKKPNYKWHDVQDYSEEIYSTAVNGNVVLSSDGNGFSLDTVYFEE